MKKNVYYLKLSLFSLFSIVCLYVSGQTTNQITISVGNIEYSDPSFGLLKESVQKNSKVSSVKQYYNQSTGRLLLTYKGAAQDLWSELPKSTKDFFKINTLDDTHIVLSLSGQSTVSKTTQAKSTADDDCKNCYWKLCNYDVVKSFGGKLYKGINYDNGTFYYNCDNGILVQKVIIQNGYGTVTKIQTDTLLVTSGPVGTRWGVFNQNMSNPLINALTGTNLNVSNGGGYTLIAKNISTQAGGKKYDDVVVVNYRSFSNDFLNGANSTSVNNYYAKGIGLIKTDTLNPNSDPVASINKTNDVKAVYSTTGTVKNGIDETILGLWVFHDAKTNTDMYYRFNKDGTFDFYTGRVAEANKLQGVNHWKVEGYNDNGRGVIDMNFVKASNSTMRYYFTKKNDPSTHKPVLLIQDAVLVSMDKQSW